MNIALYALCVVVYIITANNSRQNTWYKISNANLPSALYGESVGFYGDQLYIIGGSYSTTFSTELYYKTIYPYNVTNYTNIKLNENNHLLSWKSISDQIDHRYFTGFKCKGQCYTYINQYIFIINPESMFFDETGNLVIYDMENYQFIDYRSFNNTLIYTEAGICATNNITHIFAIGSKCLNCPTAYEDIQIYAINTNGPWVIGGYMNIGRYYSGCSIDTHQQNLYIFGGYINHNITDDTADVCSHIEKCDLVHNNDIICNNITNTQLNIARAEHQTIITRNNLIFIIGGYDNTNKLTEIVEIFDIKNNVILNNEWFTYINNGITQFGLFYDNKFDVIYSIGGINNNLNVTTNVLYYPICLLYDNCYPTVNENPINILNCNTNINIYINSSHDLYSYYFNITSDDKLISFSFSNCMSSIDTYVFLFVWNDTLNQWHEGYLNDNWQWDDNGCNNINNLHQEAFIINYPQNGFYHLVVSAHENGNYSAQFQCIFNTFSPTLEPTYIPTNYPSINPTINPSTVNPSINPTINPSTINPTINPSANPIVNPTITYYPTHTPIITYYPTHTPTEMIIFESTISESDSYKNIWFILSFICESYEDLLRIDWESLVLNGLLNVFKPDLRFILQTKIDAKLIYLKNKNDIVNIIENSNKRQLLDTTTNEIFYYDIESNVTIDVLYLNGNNISYLCQPIFSLNFIDGLSQHKHINKAQIYRLGQCDGDTLAQTWDINDKNIISKNNYAVLMNMMPMVILLAISVTIIFIGYFIQQLRGIDSLNVYKLLLFIIYFINAYSNIFFAINIWVYIVSDSFKSMFFMIIGIISVCVIVIPFSKNIYDINIFVKYWQSDLIHGVIITNWINTYGKIVYLVSFISFTTHGSMALVNSNILGIRLFSMGLPPHLQQRFSKQRWWVIFLGNMPQLIIQIILLFFFGFNEYGIFALITSILSIIIYLCNLYISFNYNNSVESMLFSWRISSVTIAKKANHFRNKCGILNKYISKTLKINPLNEKLDMLPPIQYYDTDIGGLNIYLLVTTKLSNKDKNVYSNELKTIIQNNSLSKQIKIFWNLPLNEEINIYRFKGIENTSINCMQMTSVKHKTNKKHHAQFGLSRHMKINSASTQIPTHNYDNENSDYSSSHHIEMKHKYNKNNKDFVALNNNDDNDDNETFVEDKNTKNVINGNEQYEHGFSFNSTTNEDLL